MPNGTNNNICKAHSGLKARIEQCEDDVKNLWAKIDKFTMMLFLVFGGLLANLLVSLFFKG